MLITIWLQRRQHCSILVNSTEFNVFPLNLFMRTSEQSYCCRDLSLQIPHEVSAFSAFLSILNMPIIAAHRSLFRKDAFPRKSQELSTYSLWSGVTRHSYHSHRQNATPWSWELAGFHCPAYIFLPLLPRRVLFLLLPRRIHHYIPLLWDVFNVYRIDSPWMPPGLNLGASLPRSTCEVTGHNFPVTRALWWKEPIFNRTYCNQPERALQEAYLRRHKNSRPREFLKTATPEPIQWWSEGRHVRIAGSPTQWFGKPKDFSKGASIFIVSRKVFGNE